MTDHATHADLLGAFERYYRDEASRAARVQLRLREAREAASARSAHPLRYDESGFPVTEQRATLAERIRRLLAG